MIAVQISEIARDFIVAIATIVTALVAAFGLRTWLHEAKWKQNREIARTLVRGVLKVRDAFQNARNPFLPASEFPLDYDTFNDGTDNKYKGEMHVYQKRAEILGVALTELESAVLEAEVFWGVKVHELFVEVRKCCIRWQTGVEMHLKDIYTNYTYLSTNQSLKEKIELDISPFDEKDDLSIRIKKAFDELIKFTQPFLGA